MSRSGPAAATVRSFPHAMDIQTPSFQKYFIILLLTQHDMSYQLRTSYFRSINTLADEI